MFDSQAKGLGKIIILLLQFCNCSDQITESPILMPLFWLESTLVHALKYIASMVHFVVACRALNPRFYFVHAGTKPRFLTQMGPPKSGIPCSGCISPGFRSPKTRSRRASVRRAWPLHRSDLSMVPRASPGRGT
jgi:hypothetical protein